MLTSFWLHVDIGEPSECWNWLGGKRLGYGLFNHKRKSYGAHRFAWLLVYGRWPKEQIDHLCKNRGCVNPLHLEDVSARVNTLRSDGLAALNLRKIACPRGHAYNGNNTYVTKRGQRMCRVCHRDREVIRRSLYFNHHEFNSARQGDGLGVGNLRPLPAGKSSRGQTR